MKRTVREHLTGPLGFLVSCALSVGLVTGANAWLRRDASRTPDDPANVDALRTYVPGNCLIIGCGAAPVPGWDGCSGARGMTYDGSDGSTLLLVEDECTSAKAGRDRLEQLLCPASGVTSLGTVVRRRDVDAGLLLEFSEPVDVELGCRLPQPVRCAVGNVGASGLKMLYGPDAERTLLLARQLGWRQMPSQAMAPN